MYESKQSGYDINYFDILSAKANAISFFLLAFRVQQRGGDLSFCPFQSDVGCFLTLGKKGQMDYVGGTCGRRTE